MELFVGTLKPNFLVVKFLSILNDVPDSAPDPKGFSSRLLKFKRVKPNLYNFRCPICGDSQKNKNKARGYMYPVKADMNFKCHNCGAGGSLKWLLDRLDVSLSKQYSFEKYKVENIISEI